MKEARVNAISIDYQRYIINEQQYVESARYKQDRAFWQEKLPLLPPPRIASDPGKIKSSAREKLVLPHNKFDIIEQYCRHNNIATFHYFLAVIACYFSRVYQQESIVIAVPVLNRPVAFKKSVGLFTNILPLHIQLSSSSFIELAKNINKDLRKLYRHQRLPLGEMLRLAQSTQAIPYDIKLSYEQFDLSSSLDNCNVSVSNLSNNVQNHPLSIFVRDYGVKQDVTVDFDYQLDCFSDFSISSVMETFNLLLDLPASGNDQYLQWPLLNHNNREKLQKYSRGDLLNCPYPTLTTAFEKQALQIPNHIAVFSKYNTLSYAALNAKANQLARLLLNQGVRSGDVVALYQYRSVDMMVSILSVLKAGAAYLPIDPRNPIQRTQIIIDDANIRYVLVNSAEMAARWCDNITMDAQHIEIIDVTADYHSEFNTENLNITISTRDLAYIIYTSGTTGKPKGVMVEHGAASNRIYWQQTQFPIAQNSTLIQKTPYSFDVSVWELFWGSYAGAKLLFAEPGEEGSPEQLLVSIVQHQVTAIHFVPSMFSACLEYWENTDKNLHPTADEPLAVRLQSLLYVICSGEPLLADQVKRFKQLVTTHSLPMQLINLYGPTEASIDVSYYQCVHRPSTDPDSAVLLTNHVPIGRPIANTELFIVDKHLNQLPIGIPGELAISGVGLARGYFNKPALTSSIFVPHPTHTGKRVYLTGDRARWLGDGNIEFLGRLDKQVKIRGHRVELAEIEQTMRALPYIKDAAVICKKTPNQGTQLYAYYIQSVASNDSEATDTRSVLSASAKTLRRNLAQQLPGYMVPAFFIALQHFPLSSNGKLDHKALPNPLEEPRSSHQPYVAPHTLLEKHLCAAYADVLACSKVGVEDNFFSLGGDSILMLKLKTCAARRGVLLDISKIYNYPKISDLACVLSHSNAIEEPPDKQTSFQLLDNSDKKHPVTKEDALPASQLQLGMIYHSAKNPDSAMYRDVFSYRVKIPWIKSIFTQVYRQWVKRHPALRSSFELAGSTQALQVIHQYTKESLLIYECGVTKTNELVKNYVNQRQQFCYEFKKPPLHEMAIFVCSDKVQIVFSFHHSLLDGWSVATLIEALLSGYLAMWRNNDISLDSLWPTQPSPLGYSEYIALEQAAQSDPLAKKYWQQRLQDYRPTTLHNWCAYISESKQASTEQISTITVELPSQLFQQSKQLAADLRVPIKSILLTVHCLTLQLLCGQESITTGLVCNARPEIANAEKLVGLFLNTVPFALPTSSTLSWQQLIEGAFNEERDNYQFKRYPLSSILQLNAGEMLFDSLFNFTHFHVFKSLRSDPNFTLLEFSAKEETNYTLLANYAIHPLTEKLLIKLDYNKLRLHSKQVKLYTRYCQSILSEIIRTPESTVNVAFLVKPPNTDKKEKPRLSEQYGSSFLQRLSQCARRYPERIALQFDTQLWSYRQLERLTNKLAHYFIDIGINTGDRVAFMLDRSNELIAVIIAVLKTGATYVPLDHEQPADRLKKMICDAEPSIIVVGSCTERQLASLKQYNLLSWNTCQQQLNKYSDADPASIIDTCTPAYIIFTSGSTGRPKGVIMPHRALDNLISWQLRSMPLGVAAKTLQFSSSGFDVSFQEIFSTLCSAGTLHLVSEEQRKDFKSLLELINREKIQRVFLPYLALLHLAEQAESEQLYPASLQVVITAGEQLKITEKIRLFFTRLPSAILANQYGPTECHVVSQFTLSGDPSNWPVLPPIGRAIDNTEIVILDKHGERVADGIPGELYLCGACLASAYYGKSDLTNERFIKYTVCNSDELLKEIRLYRTGDLGVRLPQGDVLYLGRIDQQVKIRGYRVEPNEIEIRIQQYSPKKPCIKQVAVTAKQNQQGLHYLCAYLVLLSPTDFNPDDLIHYLRCQLPDYMIPRDIQCVPALPLSANGKVDWLALEKTNQHQLVQLVRKTTISQVYPRDSIERNLVEIWRQVLDRENISLLDNFYDLGGHSLDAVRMVALIEKRFGLYLPLSSFITSPNVESLALIIRQKTKQEKPPARQRELPVNTCLVNFHRSGNGCPIFMVHPIGGNVICYSALAKKLQHSRPFYALQAPGISQNNHHNKAGEEQPRPSDSIESLAMYYLDAISNEYPSGPMILGGWSFGGFVAFEMARQCCALGRTPQELIILDSITLNAPNNLNVSKQQLLNWFVWELLAGDWSRGHAVESVNFDGMEDNQIFTLVNQVAVERKVIPEDTDPSLLKNMYQVFKNNWQSLLNYRLSISTQPATLFRAEDCIPEVLSSAHNLVRSNHTDPLNGWGAYLQENVTLVNIKGNHLTMMTEPHIDTVANYIKQMES